MTEHFQRAFIDDLTEIDPLANLFTPVWDLLLAAGDHPRSILDVGCGTGVFSFYVQRRTGCSVSGVDGSEYALAAARNLGFNNTQLIGDFNTDALPFADETFDFVVCKDVFEHLLNPLHLLSECRRVLQPSGRLLLHVPNHFPLLGRLKFLLTNDLDTFGYFPGSNRWEFPHIRFYEHSEFTRLPTGYGFEHVGDFSHCFAVAPILNRVRGTGALQRMLALRSPSEFAGAFTVLFRKA